jgi:hypothetical protein
MSFLVDLVKAQPHRAQLPLDRSVQMPIAVAHSFLTDGCHIIFFSAQFVIGIDGEVRVTSPEESASIPLDSGGIERLDELLLEPPAKLGYVGEDVSFDGLEGSLRYRGLAGVGATSVVFRASRTPDGPGDLAIKVMRASTTASAWAAEVAALRACSEAQPIVHLVAADFQRRMMVLSPAGEWR